MNAGGTGIVIGLGVFALLVGAMAGCGAACVRATWVKVSPDQIDRGIDFYKMTLLPALEELEGFCSASLLVDRASYAWGSVSPAPPSTLSSPHR